MDAIFHIVSHRRNRERKLNFIRDIMLSEYYFCAGGVSFINSCAGVIWDEFMDEQEEQKRWTKAEENYFSWITMWNCYKNDIKVVLFLDSVIFKICFAASFWAEYKVVIRLWDFLWKLVKFVNLTIFYSSKNFYGFSLK